MGFFYRFNGFSSNILLTFSCYFDNPQCPGVGHLNGNSQLSSNAPPMPSLPPQRLNIDRCRSINYHRSTDIIGRFMEGTTPGISIKLFISSCDGVIGGLTTTKGSTRPCKFCLPLKQRMTCHVEARKCNFQHSGHKKVLFTLNNPLKQTLS